MARERRFALFCGVVLLCAFGCRNSPTAPSAAQRLRLPTGGYLLSILYEQDHGTCVGNAASFVVTSRVRVTREGSRWVAHSVAQADGSVVVTFSELGGEPANAVFLSVAGALRGMVNDIDNAIAGSSPKRVRFGDGGNAGVELRGHGLVEAHVVLGELNGLSQVEGWGGGVVLCSSARWSITPL